MLFAAQVPISICTRAFAIQLTILIVYEYSMAQSAADSKKTPLHIEAFWEKPTVTPPLTWEKWTQQWKLALLAKEGVQLDTLLNDPPGTVTYPPEPTYEEPVENHTQATERDRKV